MFSFIEDILGSDAYWPANKKLVRELGSDAAILCAFLISKRKYYRSLKQLNDAGGFYATAEAIDEETGFTRRIREAALKTLEKAGLIVVKLEGCPARNFIYIQDLAIARFMGLIVEDVQLSPQFAQNVQTGLYDPYKLDCTIRTNCSTFRDKEQSINNKDTLEPLSAVADAPHPTVVVVEDKAIIPTPKRNALVKIPEGVLEVANIWQRWAEAEYPNLASRTKNYEQAIAKVCLAANLTPQGLKAVFEFIQKDEFWVNKAISPAGLLTKSKNGLRKIDNILAAMRHCKHNKARIIEQSLEEKMKELGIERISF